MARIGRPPLYNNCMDLDAMCELYFEEKLESGEPVLISELPFYIGFGSRHAVFDLEQNPEFSNVIKKARHRLEIECEKAMMKDKGNPTKHIFRIKQPGAGGWVDKVDHHSTQDTRIQVEVVGMPQLPQSAVAVLSGQPNQAQLDSCAEAEYEEFES
ncbi:conserved protein of unknown function [Pseudodesulfovibrio profundus]|uniref:Uncharacterized protein n=1 Tax=Pseudodesulfovibrio profundus TaxID=57320 RepID=A0A2C8FEZ1_9BACT|nr:hypothetical protein [Pseudodesulfovibrio profundus]SOB60629.1 conserved protein of unknown function [Pseudodesulfovibrio profundus]